MNKIGNLRCFKKLAATACYEGVTLEIEECIDKYKFPNNREIRIDCPDLFKCIGFAKEDEIILIKLQQN